MGWCQGKNVKPGIRRKAFAISANQVLAAPQYQRDEKGNVISGLLKGNFTLMEGAFWAEIDHLPAKATFTSETQGEYPSQTFLVKSTLVHPAPTGGRRGHGFVPQFALLVHRPGHERPLSRHRFRGL